MSTPEEIQGLNATVINAPPAAVRSSFLDFAAYPSWNPFIIRAEAGKKGGFGFMYDDGKPPTYISSATPAITGSEVATTATDAQPKRFYYESKSGTNKHAQQIEDAKAKKTEAEAAKSKLALLSSADSLALAAKDDNPFAPGSLLDLTIHPTAVPGSAILQLQGNIIVENSPSAFAWTHAAVKGWLFRGENRVEFRPLDGGARCNFVHSHHYSGALANLASWWYGEQVSNGFRTMGLALKERVEKGSASSLPQIKL
ncbi:hypothetical protein HDU87_004812 [Geranomyces variabilis]|uniref:Uncharacterized protein n=1 Tax=Geranomyces variabilis TaxID=109894 RepID=A0AAD5XRM6_9FUNG|nr:hypothetical protein HDU87_004812 [Geranomyces variabilis]